VNANVASTVSGRMMAADTTSAVRNAQKPSQNHFMEISPRFSD
jgi:hypothetical protein